MEPCSLLVKRVSGLGVGGELSESRELDSGESKHIHHWQGTLTDAHMHSFQICFFPLLLTQPLLSSPRFHNSLQSSQFPSVLYMPFTCVSVDAGVFLHVALHVLDFYCELESLCFLCYCASFPCETSLLELFGRFNCILHKMFFSLLFQLSLWARFYGQSAAICCRKAPFSFHIALLTITAVSDVL